MNELAEERNEQKRAIILSKEADLVTSFRIQDVWRSCRGVHASSTRIDNVASNEVYEGHLRAVSVLTVPSTPFLYGVWSETFVGLQKKLG